ncbi:uncharacterized protein BP5553_02406 [Venustampulla echinocandica]|uniref:SET domain-containing protein n=1 Tax=Venustampulla echinocandica TaxID=2656787 RepID=A0A370U3R4_9HELO|nr:uncharacterized protein BP5553_02406 [Venustampulla echinocandica]RDL42427.1 hypothetical protein BP5553_02406 [Venustampulla echinocandica]
MEPSSLTDREMKREATHKLTEKVDSAGIDGSFANSGERGIPSSGTPQPDPQDSTFTRPGLPIQGIPISSQELDLEIAAVEVRSTPERGQALFAVNDISLGSVVLFEKPLLMIPRDMSRTNDPPSPDPLDALVDKLPSPDKEAFLGLCCFRRDGNESVNRAVVDTNAFGVQDADAVFKIASRINHSCVANCDWDWVDGKGGGEGRLIIRIAEAVNHLQRAEFWVPEALAHKYAKRYEGPPE